MYRKMLSPALLLAILFSISFVYGGDFGVLNHNSDADVLPRWVASNTNVSLTFLVNNSNSSVNNITELQIINLNTDPFDVIALTCPSGWTGVPNSTLLVCNNSFLQPGSSTTVNLTIYVNPANVTPNAATDYYWTLNTLDYNATGPNKFRTHDLVMGVDAKGPTVNIENTTQIGNITFNVTFVEGEVAVDVNSYNYSFYGNCSGFVPSYVNNVTCTDAPQNKTCYRTFVVNTSSLPIGTCGINVNIKDTFGNVGSNSGNFAFRNDYENPAVKINSPISGWYKNSIFVNVTATDNYGVDMVEAKIGTGSWITLNKVGSYWTVNYNTSVLAEINHTLSVRATDVAGNINDSEERYNIGIDRTPPTVTITSPAVDFDIVVGSSVSITANVLDTGSGINENCSVNIGGTAVGTLTYDAGVCSGSVIVPSVGSGNKLLAVTVSDIVGNSGRGTINVVVRYVGGGGGGGGSGGTSFNTTDNSLGLGENHRPLLTAPKIDNENPKYGDKITCLPGTYSDEDKDSKVADEWRWYANGEAVLGMTSQTLEITATYKSGDKFYCMQRVTDGMSYSEWKKSSNEAVLNVEEQLSETPVAETKVETTKPVSSGITGAFLGLGDDDLGFIGTVGLASFFGLVLVISVLKNIGKRGKNFRIE